MAISKQLNVHRSSVFNIIKRFQELGNNRDRPKTGRPRSTNIAQVRHKIKARVDRNPRRSFRRLEKKVSRESVRRIAINELKIKPYKLQKAQLLIPKMMQVRLKRAKALMQLAGDRGWFTPMKQFSQLSNL